MRFLDFLEDSSRNISRYVIIHNIIITEGIQGSDEEIFFVLSFPYNSI